MEEGTETQGNEKGREYGSIVKRKWKGGGQWGNGGIRRCKE